MASAETQDVTAHSDLFRANYESHTASLAEACTPLRTEDLLEAAASLKGKVILITGGASGIGAAFATFAASQGAHVVLADLTEESIKAREKEISDSVCTDLVVAGPATDVTKWEQLLNLFEFVEKKYGGRLDAVVSSAGISEPGPPFEMDRYDENGRLKPPNMAAVDINLRGSMLSEALAISYLSLDSSSKHGILGFMRSLHYTAQPDGISVSAILPWFIDTPIIRPFPRLLMAGLPFAKMTDVVNAIAFAATAHKAAGSALAIDPKGVMLLPHQVNENGTGGFHMLFGQRAVMAISTIRSIRIASTMIAGRFARSRPGIFLIGAIAAYFGCRLLN